MKKHGALIRLISITLLCALPYILIPVLSEYLPEGMVWGLTFFLCNLLAPLSAAFAPFFIARAGIPAIAAWPWPALCALILPLWGLRPTLFAMVTGVLVAIISAVAGEEWRKRKENAKGVRGRKKR